MGLRKEINKTKKSKAAPVMDIPYIVNVPNDIQSDAVKYLKKLEEIKKLEKEADELAKPVVDFALKYQDEQGHKNCFDNSYRIRALDKILTFVTKNVFKIDDKNIPAIREFFGDSFKDYINEKIEVTMKEEVFEDKELQKELMTLLGPNFAKFFNSFSSYKVVEDYNEDIYKFANTPEKLAEIRKLVVPSKPSLK